MCNASILYLDASLPELASIRLMTRKNPMTNNYCCNCRGTTRQNAGDICMGESFCTICGAKRSFAHARRIAHAS